MANPLLDAIFKFVFSMINKDGPQVSITIPLPMEIPEQAAKQTVDWNDPNCKISKHFTVKEALWLPSWQVMHIPSEEEKANILKHAANMDKIREFLGASLNVHCWIRPGALNNPNSDKNGQDYNAFVKGAKNSSHKLGLATDYDASGLNCDDVRAKLEPKLEEFGLRMERMPNGPWVHNDSASVPVGGNRYFIP